MSRTQAIAPRILLFGLCLWWGLAASAQAAGRDLAVLVVGRSTDATMAAQERQIIDKLNQGRNQRGWNPRTLPIYSYHFDKDGERVYCEQRLKVKATDLVVVGLVELEGGVPVHFVYRESNVRNAEKCADMVMERAKAELASRGVTVAARPSTPTSTPRPVVVVSPRPPVVPAGSPTVRPVVVSSPTTRPVVTVTPSPRPVVVSSPTTRPVVTVTPSPRPVVVVTPTTRPVVTVTPTPRPVTPSPGPVTSTPVAVQTPGPIQTVTANPNDRWAIQVGLVSSLDKARILAQKMKDEGHKPVEIRKMAKDGKVMFRVLIGFFSAKTDVVAKVKEMRDAGVDCFSVLIDPSLGQVVH